MLLSGSITMHCQMRIQKEKLMKTILFTLHGGGVFPVCVRVCVCLWWGEVPRSLWKLLFF